MNAFPAISADGMLAVVADPLLIKNVMICGDLRYTICGNCIFQRHSSMAKSIF